MRKIIYLILVALSLLAFNKTVYGVTFYSEVYEDIAISKDNGKITTFTYASRFYQTGTNLLSYCIEPFVTLTNNGTYIEYDTNNSNLNLTNEKLDRINKLAYYGYGYGNHTGKKWITVTQMMIWRTVSPSSKFNWLDNLSSRRIIHPYDAEINELERLVSNHGKKPSFENGEYTIKDKLELTDNNGVLNEYKVKSTTLVSASIDNNTLKIEADNVNGEGEVVLVKEGNVGYISKYYYNSSSQNIMLRGDYDPIEVKLKLNVVKGTITINKVDEDLGTNVSQGEGDINGAVFELYDENKELVRTIELDETGKAVISNLNLGTYILIEKEPGNGYVKDYKEYLIELNEDNREVSLIITNKVIESKLVIKKLYGSKKDLQNKKMKPEKGITFEIYNQNNELVTSGETDSYGTLEVMLPYGTYRIVQKNTTENYQMVEDRIVTIGSDSDVVINIELNDVEIEVPNAGIDGVIDICRVWSTSFYK